MEVHTTRLQCFCDSRRCSVAHYGRSVDYEVVRGTTSYRGDTLDTLVRSLEEDGALPDEDMSWLAHVPNTVELTDLLRLRMADYPGPRPRPTSECRLSGVGDRRTLSVVSRSRRSCRRGCIGATSRLA